MQNRMPKNDIRYLKNIGIPSHIVLDMQASDGWLEEDGTYKEVEIIRGSRRIATGHMEPGTDEEAILIQQIGLDADHKCFIWKKKDKTIVRREIVERSITRTVKNWPHIIEWKAGGEVYESDRTYTIPVAGSKFAKRLGSDIAEIRNVNDFKRLWNTFGCLVEVDEKGEVINEHPPQDNTKATGNMPMFQEVSVDSGKFARANPSGSGVNSNPLPESADVQEK
jgi:hypothetical protein